jgi:hypothetical protein
MRSSRRVVPRCLVAAAVVVLALAADGATRTAESVTCSSTAVPKDLTGKPIALTGIWAAEDGRYRLRQVGSCLWWVGNTRSSNVFFGNIFQSTITGAWADVLTGKSGSRLTLTIDRLQQSLSRRSTTGEGHPATNWRKAGS